MSPKRRTQTLLALAFVAGAAALLAFALDDPARGRARGIVRVAQLQWQPGTVRSYAISVRNHARIELLGQSMQQPVDQRVEGTLHLRVLAVETDSVRLGFQLTHMNLSATGGSGSAISQRGSGPPFLAVFGRDGSVRAFEFPRTTPDRLREILEQTVRTFQCVVPIDAGTTWQTRESDALGVCSAEYERRDDGSIHKQRTGYASKAGAIEVVRSNMSFDLSTVSWVDRASISDTIRIEGEEKARVEGRTLATLRILPAIVDPRIDLLRIRGGYDEVREAVLRHHVPVPKIQAPPEPKPTREQVVSTVRGLNASDGSDATSIVTLRKQLIAEPAFTAIVVAMLEAEGTTDGTDAALLNALGIAGTPEAQVALTEVLLSPERRHNNRLRAAVAISFSGAPSENSIDALWLAAKSRSDKRTTDLSNTSLLAIGTATGTLRLRGSPAARVQRTRLLDRLERAADPLETEVVLKALGNSRDPAVRDTLVARLTDSDPGIRAAAAYALRTMPANPTADLLADRLKVERVQGVRRALATSLARLETPTVRALDIAHAQIEEERDEPTRHAMAELLSQHGATNTAYRETMARLLEKETSRRIRICLAEAIYRTGKKGTE